MTDFQDKVVLLVSVLGLVTAVYITGGEILRLYREKKGKL